TFLFAHVRAVKSIDKAEEPFLAQELEWLRTYESFEHVRASYLYLWLQKYLSEIYSRGGDEIRALMLQDDPQSSFYRTGSNIDRMLEFRSNAQNAFDQFLVRNYKYTAEELHEIKALNFLYDGDLSKAAETLRQAGALAMKDLNADPFMIHIKDCHDCDFLAPHMKYTKLTFVERLLSLSARAQGQGQAAADASLELANGFYNMTHYGNSRFIYENSHKNFANYIFDLKVDPKTSITHKTELAEKYYLQAAALSPDREFKAKALFMASKAEQGRRYNINPTDGNNVNPSPYFKSLKDLYSDTRTIRKSSASADISELTRDDEVVFGYLESPRAFCNSTRSHSASFFSSPLPATH